MRKLRVLLLAGVMFLAGCGMAFADISGEIGILATEDDTNIFTEIEAREDFDIVEFSMGTKIEKTRSNGQTTKDNFKIWTGYQRNFEEKFISGDLEFENDDVQSFQRTSIIGSVGKNFKLREIDLMTKAGLGYSWAGTLSNGTVLKVEEEAKWKALYQKAIFFSPLDNLNEMEFSSEVGAKTELTENLTLKTCYEFEYHEAFNDKYDHTFRSSIGFSF